MGKIEDAKLYRELLTPHADRKAAAAAIDAFHADLREIRKKHRIPDVVTIIKIPYAEDDKEHAVLTYFQDGSYHQALPMVAQAFGAMRRDHVRLMESMSEDDE